MSGDTTHLNYTQKRQNVTKDDFLLMEIFTETIIVSELHRCWWRLWKWNILVTNLSHWWRISSRCHQYHCSPVSMNIHFIIEPWHITAFRIQNRIWRPFYFRFLAHALNNVNMSILAHLTTFCLKTFRLLTNISPIIDWIRHTWSVIYCKIEIWNHH